MNETDPIGDTENRAVATTPAGSQLSPMNLSFTPTQ